MNQYTQETWLKRGTELFGNDPEKWEFVCPACEKTQTAKDFEKYIAQKLERLNTVYTQCIGRFTGGKNGTHKCDWASFGFFNICNTEVDNVPVFDFKGD